MKNRQSQNDLTEMEGAALAIIARHAPATPYVVREAFRSSPSEFWSGSAGAIYPLMQRLEKRKLLSSREDTSTQRARRLYRLTRQGEMALESWLTDINRAIGLGFDPLRTRLFFSDLLSAGQKEQFLQETVKKLTEEKTPAPSDKTDAILLHNLWQTFRLKTLQTYIKKSGKE